MKIIKVLGSGCRNCEITANVIAQIMACGVMSTHGVVVDGKEVHSGGVPGPDQVRAWMTE